MNKKAKPGSAALLVILAGTLWGITSIFVKGLNSYDLTATEIGALRTGVCTAALFFIILIYKPALFKINLRDIWMFAGTGLLSLVFFSFCYFSTIISAGASVAVSLLYTSPIWVMLFSAVLFKERLTLKKTIAIPITVLGCALTTGIIGTDTAALTPKIIITGMLSGIGYALYSVFGRYATEKYNSLTITFYTFLLAFLGFLYFTKPAELIQKCTADSKVVILTVLIGTVSSLLPYIFYTIGLNKMEASVAAILVAVEPLVGCIIGITVFNEKLSALKMTGIALILISIIILNIRDKKHDKNKKKLRN